MLAWNTKTNFQELIKKDLRVKKYLKPKEIEECFDLDFYTKNVNYIFKRVF